MEPTKLSVVLMRFEVFSGPPYTIAPLTMICCDRKAGTNMYRATEFIRILLCDAYTVICWQINLRSNPYLYCHYKGSVTWLTWEMCIVFSGLALFTSASTCGRPYIFCGRRVCGLLSVFVVGGIW